MRCCVVLVPLVLMTLGAQANPNVEGRLMRYADVHGDQIVFTYEDDLWLVTAPGGDARRITAHPGVERYAKFSPDGTRLAFTAEYDGGSDVYVMDARGGEPTRLTYHPASDRVLGWTPDGGQVLFRSRRQYPTRAEQVYAVSVDGGMPERLPVDRAGLASLSPDGTMLAYNRFSREDRTWKRYQGGQAQDIWIGELATGTFRRVTDWPGTDNYPMWVGDKIIFCSDRNHGTLNLFELDPSTGAVRPLTDYGDVDVKYPSAGPAQIVFQRGGLLYVLVLATGQVMPVPVRLPTDRVPTRAELVAVADQIDGYRLSPSGSRLVLESRGEIINVPVDEGIPVNLTRYSGSREKGAVWSPDGRWIAFLSDLSGEEEVYLIDQLGEGSWRRLTTGGMGYRANLTWSPASTHLLFTDKFMRLNLVDVGTGAITVIDQGSFDDAWERWGIQDVAWSPCGRWVAYSKMEANMNESIFLYSLDRGTVTRVTSEMTQDWSPTFDPGGRFLYFLSNRTYAPVMGRVDQNHVFLDMTLPYLVLLRDGERSPFVPEDPREPAEDGDVAEEPAGAGRGPHRRNASPATAIDLDGLQRRIVAAEGIDPASYFRLMATSDGLLMLRRDEHPFLKYTGVTDDTSSGYTLVGWTLEDAEAADLMAGVGNVHLSADGARLLYRSGDILGVVDAGAPAEVGDGRVDLDDVHILVDRRAEFEQIFDEAWRIERDWMYDAALHQVDWDAVGERYRALVPYCGNRGDLNYLIGEMIGELNIGHAYVYGGDLDEGGPTVRTGLLGVELETPSGQGYHRIAHIIPGVPGDPAQRSPLDEPGVPVREGDYIIAIDGQEVTAADNVWRHLQDKAGRWIRLTTNSAPTAQGARTTEVRTLVQENAIRYREWVEERRAIVERASGGALGYVHVPSMMQSGLVEFARGYYAQTGRQGMIIDVRYNGGGFVADMIIDRLERRLWALTQPREGVAGRNPERAFHGPMVVLINGDSGSNAEFFAEAVKRKGLATVVGTRTWGGSIGLEPHQDLVDGGMTTPPQFGLYGLDRTWLIEGRGVEPDMEVENTPADELRGNDAQLLAAVELLQQQIQAMPAEIPPPPPYPDKSRPAP